MAFHIPGIGSEEWYQADLLSDLFSAGKSARLYQSLIYEKQIAQEAYAFTFSTEKTALFIIMATGHKNVTVDKLEKAITEEIGIIVY